MRAAVRLACATLVACCIAAPTPAAAGAWPGQEADKPRTIVTTDPELDDLNSMIHFLLYANEFRTEGLVYASGRYHWKGDGKGTEFFLPDREYDTPQTQWRWPSGSSHIEQALDAYEDVYPNLRVHAPGYPTPAELRSKFRVGNIEFEGDTSKETPGSKLIERVLLDDKGGPVYLQAWGGPSTIARALMSIESRHKGTSRWPAIYRKVSRKAIITKFGSQDNTYSEYISPRWPAIETRDVATDIWGYGVRGAILPKDRNYLTSDWMGPNVSARGPFGSLYRVWGDGKQMVPGDKFDHFGFSGLTTEQLRAMGYVVWTPPRPKGEWISEGDSSNFALLIDNGLRSAENANNGGWGGRQQQNPGNPSEYLGDLAQDADDNGATPEDYKTSRWFAPMMNDFSARMKWSVTPRRRGANHEPIARVRRGALDISVQPGQRVRLSGLANDPDGDRLRSRWWQYREAGSYPGAADVSPTHRPESRTPWATLSIPRDAKRGQTVHVILEVRDDGQPALTSYQRVTATVR